MTKQSMIELLSEIRETAEKSGCLIVEGVLGTGDRAPIPMCLNMQSRPFLDLLSKARPTIVYVHAENFDAEEDLFDELEFDDDEQVAAANHRRVKAVIKKWSEKNGEISLISASFMKDAVMHIMIKAAEWYEQFEDAVSELGAALQDEAEVESGERKRAAKAALREYADMLRNHPKFNGAARVSKEKRLFLAGELFPDLDHSSLYEIVELATNVDWLEN